MSGKIKKYTGSVLPIIAAALPIAFPALSPFAPLIVGAAGLAGSYLTQRSIPIEDWGKKKDVLEDMLSNQRTTQKTVPIVYGERLVGSNDVYMDMSRESGRTYLWVVSCVSEGEINGIAQTDDLVPEDKIYINDVLVSEFNKENLEQSGGLDAIEYFVYTGSDSQAASPEMQAASPKFTDPMRDTAYIVWKILWDKKIFAGVPRRGVVLEGIKTFDPRISATAYTRNPAIHLRDYLTNERYGMGFQESAIDDSSFISAANYCDGINEPKWEVNYVVSYQTKSQFIIDSLLSHFRGSMSWSEGSLKLHYFELSEEPIVGDITDADIASDQEGYPMALVNQPSFYSTPDSALVKYISEIKEWNLDDVYIGEKSGQAMPIFFPGFTNRSMALEMGVYNLERTQLNRSISLTTRQSNLVYEPGDLVRVDSEELGLSGKVLRLTETVYQEGGMIQLSFVSEDISLYNAVYDLDPAEAYEIDIASPHDTPPSVYNISFQEEVYSYRDRTFVRLNISFDPPHETPEGKTYPWFDHVRVYVSYVPEPYKWDFLFIAPDDFQIDPVSEGPIWIKLVSVSIFNNAQSFEDGPVAFHRVRGISEIPPVWEQHFSANVSGSDVVVRAPVTGTSDIDGYELRMGNDWPTPSYNRWVDAAKIDFSYRPLIFLNSIKPGNHTLWMDIRGKNGLYSGFPYSVDIDIYEPPAGYLNADALEDLPDISISYDSGTHSGTNAIDFFGYRSLQVNRGSGGSNKEGEYVSSVVDAKSHSITRGRPILAAIEAGLALSSPANSTWPEIAPGSTKWTDLAPDGQTTTWDDITGGAQSEANISISLEQSASASGPWTLAGKGLEETTCEIKFRYIRLRFYIADSTLSGYYTIGPSTLKRYARPVTITEMSCKAKSTDSCSAGLSLTISP